MLVMLKARITHSAQSPSRAVLGLTMPLCLELNASDDEDDHPGACLQPLTPLPAVSAFTCTAMLISELFMH
jgi:hypothetical protein